MKILRFEIDGLFGREQRISADVSSDLAIITGRNGAGKTSVLKLLWAVISGNILTALQEVVFTRLLVVTDEYECTVFRLNRNTCRVKFISEDKEEEFEDWRDEDDNVFENAEDQANKELIKHGRSVFFPTFRRIEGGFSVSPRRVSASAIRVNRAKNDLEEALFTLSRSLTNEPHVFVSAISTADIAALLLRRYAEFSDNSNTIQASAYDEIVRTIKSFKYDKAMSEEIETPSEQERSASQVLEDIQARIEKMEADRQTIMQPLDELRTLATRLFRHNGIKFDARMSFGDAANAINSDALSAGEKQMLSFVCYNTFYRDSIIFIDEPELSLHADWQRQIFTILSRQNSGNQFIAATHSPFIYSKYPDKEIAVNVDRGHSNSHE